MKLSYINLLLTLTIDIIGVIFAVEKYRTSAMLSNALYWTCDVARRCSQCIGMPCCIYSKDTERIVFLAFFDFQLKCLLRVLPQRLTYHVLQHLADLITVN